MDAHTPDESGVESHLSAPVESGSAPQAASEHAPAKGKTGLLVGTVAAVAVLIIGLVVALSAHSSSAKHAVAAPSGSTKAVLDSVMTTLGDKTADQNIDITMNIDGENVTASGGGQVDFTSNSSKFSITYHGDPSLDGETISEVAVGGAAYVGMPEVSQLIPGKSWISEDIGSAQSLSPGTQGSADYLQELAGAGNIVTPIDSATVGGTAVNEYRVTVPMSLINQRLAKLSGSGALTSQIISAADSALKTMASHGGITYDVAIDPATSHVLQITATYDLAIAGQKVNVAMNERMSNFGTPVVINAPDPSTVVSLQQFEQAAQQAAQSNTAK